MKQGFLCEVLACSLYRALLTRRIHHCNIVCRYSGRREKTCCAGAQPTIHCDLAELKPFLADVPATELSPNVSTCFERLRVKAPSGVCLAPRARSQHALGSCSECAMKHSFFFLPASEIAASPYIK